MSKGIKHCSLQVQNIYETYIDKEFKCDTFFPKIDTNIFRFMSQEIHEKDVNLENDELDDDFTVFDRVYTRGGEIAPYAIRKEKKILQHYGNQN